MQTSTRFSTTFPKDHPQCAKRVQLRLKAVIELLRDYPRIGTPTNDRRIRRAVALPHPYLVFYEVTQNEIIVHAIRHGARDPRSMPGSD